MAAIIRDNIADEKFCETTIGAADEDVGADFKVRSVESDFASVEIYGALVNSGMRGNFLRWPPARGQHQGYTVLSDRLGLHEIISFEVKF